MTFSKAWIEVKKALLPTPKGKSAHLIGPNWSSGMYSDGGPIDHTLKIPVGQGIDILQQNIERLNSLRNRRHDQWPNVRETGEWASDEEYEDPRGGRGTVESILRELGITPDDEEGWPEGRHAMKPDEEIKHMGLFEHPHNIEQRRIARHGGGAGVKWDPWQQAVAPHVLDRALALERDQGSKTWMPVAHGTAGLSGDIGNLSLVPGMGGQGYGHHLLANMLQTYGRVGDGTYSPEAYAMWNRLGDKMTEGGHGSRMTINRPHWGDSNRPDTVDHLIRRKNPAGDMVFQRPVLSNRGYFKQPEKRMLEGGKWEGPHMHPYEFSKIPEQANRYTGASRRTNPELRGTYPLELRYEGSERNPLSDMRTHIGSMKTEDLPMYHPEGTPMKHFEHYSERNPDSRIAQLLSEGYFSNRGWA